MGLMLSILVICVGVIEALSCYEHFQYGVIHCATNIYESTRRSSLFLTYTSKKLGLLAKESAPELSGKLKKNFNPFRSLDESVSASEERNLSNGEPYSCKLIEKSTVMNRSEKKLKKQDKIDIVKKHFARPAIMRPNPPSSFSMPELVHTEEDIELSKIINDLAIEPIEEVDVEIETSNPETLEKEFEKLFTEHENLTLSHVCGEKHLLEDTNQNAQNSKSPVKTDEKKVESNLNEKNKPEILEKGNLNGSSNESGGKKDINCNELKKKFFEEKISSKSFSQKISNPEPAVGETYLKEALVKQYLSQEPAKRQLKRSISAFDNRMNSTIAKNISPAPMEQISDPPKLTSTPVIPLNKSFDLDETDSLHKLADVILKSATPTNAYVEKIDKTFEEIYSDLKDETSDVVNMYKELEENIVNKLGGQREKIENIDVKFAESQIKNTKMESSPVKVLSENIPQTILMKAVDQFANLIVKDCLKEFKKFRFEKLITPTKAKTSDINDSGKELELKLENGLMDKATFLQNDPVLNENFQTDLKNSEILENIDLRLLEKDNKIQPKKIVNEKRHLFQFSCFENDLMADNACLNYVTLTGELEHLKISDKIHFGNLIDLERDKISVKSDVINNVSKILKDSLICGPVSQTDDRSATKGTQLSKDFKAENSLSENTQKFGQRDTNDKETEFSVKQKSVILAIKGEVLPAIEYKNKKNVNTQGLEKEIITMGWKTAPEKFQSVNENTSDSFLKQSVSQNIGNGNVRELKSSSKVIDNLLVESDPNYEDSYEVAVVPDGRLQTLEPSISKSTEKIENEIQIEDLDLRELHSTENKPKLEIVSDGLNALINNNTKLLAVNDDVLLSLEYKKDKNDSDQGNKKKIIPMEWKTNNHKKSINSEYCGSRNKKELTEQDPEQFHKKVDENESNLENLNSKKSVELVSLVVSFSTTYLGSDQTVEEPCTDNVFKSKETTESILTENTEYQKSLTTQGNDAAQTEILKPNLEKASVNPELKLSSESNESLSSGNDFLKEIIHTGENGAGIGNIPERKNLVEREKEDKNELFNDSKKLNARNNNKEVKDTNSAPEAFWLIFSGEYTKAMSKDWHSGHFSCWQCDEALTGQRYVLRDDHPYCIKCYESVFANVCEECNKIIGIDSKDLSYKDKHWHEACFLCNKCRVSLVDKQFGSKADKIYCGNCYDAQFASRCDGCGEIFRAGTKKMEYKTRQWHEKCFCCCVCKTPIGTKSFIPREQEIYCATCYEEKFATRCVKCNKIITSGGVTYKNEPWHRECFTCTNCNTSLAGQRFTSRDEKPYCADCFGELFAKRCTACNRPITGIGGTRFISFEDRHWHNDCFICASCKTSLVGRGFITDGDDIICPECAKQKLM